MGSEMCIRDRQYLDCLHHIDQPFFTPVYDFCSPSLVSGRVALVGDAASTPRPHMGFGVSKAGAEAQALAEALSNYDDIDQALAAYNTLPGNASLGKSQSYSPVRKTYVDLRSLPLRQYLIRARLAAGAVRNSRSRMHLLVPREAWWCLDVLSDWIPHRKRHGSRTAIKIRVRHQDCRVSRMHRVWRGAGGH